MYRKCHIHLWTAICLVMGIKHVKFHFNLFLRTFWANRSGMWVAVLQLSQAWCYFCLFKIKDKCHWQAAVASFSGDHLVTLLKKDVSFVSLCLEKEDQCLMPEAWNVDQGVITKLKEQYKKERKGKKGVKSKWKTLHLKIINLTSFTPLILSLFQCFPKITYSFTLLLLTAFLFTSSQGLKLMTDDQVTR